MGGVEFKNFLGHHLELEPILFLLKTLFFILKQFQTNKNVARIIPPYINIFFFLPRNLIQALSIIL